MRPSRSFLIPPAPRTRQNAQRPPTPYPRRIRGLHRKSSAPNWNDRQTRARCKTLHRFRLAIIASTSNGTTRPRRPPHPQPNTLKDFLYRSSLPWAKTKPSRITQVLEMIEAARSSSSPISAAARGFRNVQRPTRFYPSPPKLTFNKPNPRMLPTVVVGMPRSTWTKGRHSAVGLPNQMHPRFRRRPIAFRVLHSMHEQTMFSHVVGPPDPARHMIQIQILRSKHRPQYWHVFRSRSNMLYRVNFTSFLGNRSNNSRTITRGMRILNEIV